MPYIVGDLKGLTVILSKFVGDKCGSDVGTRAVHRTPLYFLFECATSFPFLCREKKVSAIRRHFMVRFAAEQ